MAHTVALPCSISCSEAGASLRAYSTQGCRGRGGLALRLLAVEAAGAATSSTPGCRGDAGRALLLLFEDMDGKLVDAGL